MSTPAPIQVKQEIHSLESYNIGLKESHECNDQNTVARLERLKQKYDQEGVRRTVEAVLLVHQHNHPHVLILQQGQLFKLPGGRCKPGEDEQDCLKRKLSSKLAPPGYQGVQWDVVDTVATWYRPNFEPLMYPYVPPHVTKPKEVKKVYLVTIPPRFQFSVPRNFKLLAVPLFELYENTRRYGSVLASLPQSLSRYSLQCAESRM